MEQRKTGRRPYDHRVDRRQLLQGAAFTSAAAFLAACGAGAQSTNSGSAPTSSGTSGGQAGAVATLSPSSPATPAAAQPVKGGTLAYVIGGDPPNLDMHANSTYLVNHTMSPVYNMLVKFAPMKSDEAPDTIVGDLAKSWELSNDGLKYTFKLNEGVTFHDGKALTSADVKASIERVMNPPKSVVSPRQDSLGVVDKLETPDASTVSITLKRPSPSTMPILAQGWMSIYSEKDINGGFDFKLKTNGTGPFKLREYIRGNRLVYDANENYFVKGRPYLKGLTAFIVRDPGAQVTSFQSGELMFSGIFAATDIKTLQGALKDKIVVERRNGFGFNTINFGAGAPWRDERVRRAVSLAMDRETGINLISEGEGEIGGYLSPGGPWTLSKDEIQALPGYAKYSDKVVAEAKALLQAAGVKDGHQTTILTRQGKGTEDLSLFIRDQLLKVGLDAKPQILEDAAAYDALNKRTFDMAPWGHAIALDDPDAIFSEFYITGAPRNYSELSSPQVDALFNKQSATLDQKERVKLVKEMQTLAIPLYGKVMINWSLRRWAWTSRLHGYTAHVGLYNNNSFAGVWLTEK